MKIIIFFFYVLVSVISAEISVDQAIHTIRNAPASERVKLMNALKVRISQMNNQERLESIQKVQTDMKHNSSISKQTAIQCQSKMQYTNRYQNERTIYQNMETTNNRGSNWNQNTQTTNGGSNWNQNTRR